MVRRSGVTLAFPPFTYAVKWLVIINSAIYVLMLLASGLNVVSPSDVYVVLGIVPKLVIHGWVWQVVTYAFIHGSFWHLFGNMIGLWMFGSQFETDWGRKQFLEFYFFCVVGAALTSIIVGYGALAAAHSWQAPLIVSISQLVKIPTVGASGGVFGIMLAYAILYGDQEFLMWFLVPIKARYLVAIFLFIALVGALGDTGGVANFAHLGGAFFGWVYLRFVPRRGLGFATSEGYFGFRNRYIKWKRRRAAKKFEVYMRKQNQPTNYGEYFDEYGNYRDPNAKKKDDGEGRGPWVN